MPDVREAVFYGEIKCQDGEVHCWLGVDPHEDTSALSLWLKSQDMDTIFYDMMALSDEISKLIIFHVWGANSCTITVLLIDLYLSLRSLCDMKVVF